MLHPGGQAIARLCTALGCVGLAFVVLAYCDQAISSRMAVATFQQAAAQAAPGPELNADAPAPDQSLWSDSARAKYAKSAKTAGVPLALLKIERLKLVAPVFAGTDAITLNRGLGAVEGTALPGQAGNVALSGHRDSFFRPLKDIAVGDTVELQTPTGTQHFRVDDIRIVDPLDVSVLDPTDSTVLTLITCYPFYYVGFAPDRYVVRATLMPGAATGQQLRDPAAPKTQGG